MYSYRPVPICEEKLQIMCRLARLHLEMPFAGARMIRDTSGSETSFSAFRDREVLSGSSPRGAASRALREGQLLAILRRTIVE